jgi:fibronectin type 3 domain-containing protein
MLSCDTYHPAAIEEEEGKFLPPPTKVAVKVGNGIVELRWDFQDQSLVKEYRVYRKEQGEAQFRRVSVTTSLSYRDDFLTNGVRYAYEIAAVSTADVEGEHSKTVSATPAIYSILLAGGAQYTNRRSVSLTITAPANTSLMMLSNDSLFTEARWEQVTSSRFWELTFGDGEKTVYAKFRNADDQETAQSFKAKIILDTIATISFVEEDSQGRNLSAPEKLHIRLSAGEIKGKATADIYDIANNTSGQELDIRLYDDGTNGDPAPDDGFYETDYFVRRGLEVINAYVYGHFTDAAGNVAPTATAPGRVNIQLSPTSVVLQEPTTIAGSSTSLSLRWTRNTDNDFVTYILRRSRDFVVSQSSTIVKEFGDSQITSYIDTGLEPATKYYYRIYVVDTAGNSMGSNIVEGTTPGNEPPKPVVLSQPTADTLGLRLSWSPSSENDFANYRLYRSTAAPVDTAVAPIVVINNAQITQYRDISVIENLNYYYRLFVFDQHGLSAGSNEVQGRKTR